MATWTSDVDVLEDLNMLSEFSAGCDCVEEIPIVSYSSYGRGSVKGQKASSRPSSPEFNVVWLTSSYGSNLSQFSYYMCTGCCI
jgi:hypothetical protein